MGHLKGNIMPLIKTYEVEEATGELKELYDVILKMRGSVGSNAKLFSSSPELLKQQMEFIKYYMNHPTLSMPLLAALRILVSDRNRCDFCVDFNTAMLVNMFDWSLEEVDAMKKDTSKAKFEQKEVALLVFVLKSVKDSLGVTQDDVDRLRDFGWSDKDILDATSHGARMVYADIMFNTFKIEDFNG